MTYTKRYMEIMDMVNEGEQGVIDQYPLIDVMSILDSTHSNTEISIGSDDEYIELIWFNELVSVSLRIYDIYYIEFSVQTRFAAKEGALTRVSYDSLPTLILRVELLMTETIAYPIFVDQIIEDSLKSPVWQP